jgi:hypothetical protein
MVPNTREILLIIKRMAKVNCGYVMDRSTMGILKMIKSKEM